MQSTEVKGVIVAAAEHRWLEDGSSRFDATAQMPDGKKVSYFLEISGDVVPPRVQRDDFLVLGLLYYAMRHRCDLHIEGSVSRQLLINLEEFQRAWTMWLPDRYRACKITAREEVVETHKTMDRIAVAAFSGGVDATFAVARHVNRPDARDRCKIATGVLIHGFDIDLKHEKSFGIVRENARRLAEAMNIPLTVIKTNWKCLTDSYWEDEYCAGLTGCLSMFSEIANIALMGSGEDYKHFVVPWSSNPITNYLLSSETFRNVTEGAGFTRTDKVREIGRLPQVADRLRVCWQGPQTGENCGVCEKCLRTKLNFLANDLPIPPSLGATPTPMEIARIKAFNDVQVSFLEEILMYAQRSRMSKASIRALRVALLKNRIVNRVPFTRHVLRAIGGTRQWLRRLKPPVASTKAPRVAS